MVSKSGRRLLEVRKILKLRNVVFFLAAVLLKQGQNVVEVCTRVGREQVLHVGVDCPPGVKFTSDFCKAQMRHFKKFVTISFTNKAVPNFTNKHNYYALFSLTV